MRKPLWTKGLMLSQQHLQAQDRYYEELLSFGRDATHFRPWGFSSLTLDREGLGAGVLGISEATGFFPDGLPFSVPDGDAAPAPIPLEGRWENDRSSLLVHLAIPEQVPGRRAVSLGEDGAGSRFVAEVMLRRDDNTGEQERPIQVARRNLRLLAEDDGVDGQVMLPVARVVRDAGGGFEFDPRFVPPLVNIAASPAVMTLARRLVELLAARSSALSGARRERGRGLADFGVSDMASFWLLYTVNTHLPGFRHLMESGRSHPERLFRLMLELAGALATFSDRADPAALPAYDHADPGPPLLELDEAIRELLETVVPSNHVTLPLMEVEPTIHAVALDQDRYFAARAMYLAVQSDADASEVGRQGPRLLKASSADHLRELLKRALPGVALTHAARLPEALPARLGVEYFEVGRSGGAWDAVTRARNFAVYVPAEELPGARLHLVILLERG